MEEKKTKRSRTKYPGLVKGVNPKTRWEYLDQDYIDKLSDSEKEWLSNFNEEWLSGNFNHEGEQLHKTPEEKRECYTRNNARNRDLYTISRTRGWVVGMNESQDAIEDSQVTNPQSQEDALLTLMELKDKIKKESEDA